MEQKKKRRRRMMRRRDEVTAEMEKGDVAQVGSTQTKKNQTSLGENFLGVSNDYFI